jgi:hypothetical protein
VCTTQNGVDGPEALACLGRARVLGGSIRIQSLIRKPGCIVHNGLLLPQLLTGALPGAAPFVPSQLKRMQVAFQGAVGLQLSIVDIRVGMWCVDSTALIRMLSVMTLAVTPAACIRLTACSAACHCSPLSYALVREGTHTFEDGFPRRNKLMAMAAYSGVCTATHSSLGEVRLLRTYSRWKESRSHGSPASKPT